MMSNPKPDSRLIAISDLMAQYSMGNFDQPEIELSEDLDEIDSIISGINMLGEELKAATVSRDFFAEIYNTVSNILIVTDTEGEIVDLNESTENLTGYSREDLLNRSIFDFVLFEEQDLVEMCKIPGERVRQEIMFKHAVKERIPVDVVWSNLYNSDESFKGFLIVAEDLTDKKNKEREILLSITETQESERSRVANDLHDSLGQELASIRMMLTGVSFKMKNDENKARLEQCTALLDTSLSNIRKICFDLVPSALEKGDFLTAIRQTVKKYEEQDDVSYNISCSAENIDLSLEKQIAIYRVFQEFVHNAIKHAKCSEITVDIDPIENGYQVVIADNGVGFKIAELSDHDGRGLSTMTSRVKILGGFATISSVLGKGTQIIIKFIRDTE